MVVAKEMPTTSILRRSVNRLAQVVEPLTFQINSQNKISIYLRSPMWQTFHINARVK